MKAIKRLIALFIVVPFLSTSIMPVAYAGMPQLLAPGSMVGLTPAFTPAHLMGLTIDPKNALKFDFLIHKGEVSLTDIQKREEYRNLIKYFLAALTIPNDNQWVNLSPYEGNRIIKDDFGKTEMGRDLLAQDYMLKQLTASLMHPDTELGKKFWDKVYEQAYQKYGTTDVPVDTFNKVWVTADDASVFEKDNTALVVNSHLKIMTERDYVATENNAATREMDSQPEMTESAKISAEIVKEIIIPAIEKEVNEGKTFANLRQIYSSMILAVWFKKQLRESILGKAYADHSAVKGVDQDPKNNEEIYQKYLLAFKKGAFNMIKEDVDRYTNEVVPRKYFSGGAKVAQVHPATEEDARKGSGPVVAENKVERVGTALATEVTPTKVVETAIDLAKARQDISDIARTGEKSLPSDYRMGYADAVLTGTNYRTKDGLVNLVKDIIKNFGFYVRDFNDRRIPGGGSFGVKADAEKAIKELGAVLKELDNAEKTQQELGTLVQGQISSGKAQVMSFVKSPVFGWKVPSTATSINDIPEAIRNVGSIDKRKYTDADVQAAAAAGGFVVIQLLDGQIESYIPSAKAFRGYKETAASVVGNLNADLMKAAQGSADLNALIQSGAVAAFEKPGEVRMVHIADLGLGRSGVIIQDPWGGQQTQTEGRYGFIVLDQGDQGPQYYMVNAEATGLPASYVPANKESADVLKTKDRAMTPQTALGTLVQGQITSGKAQVMSFVKSPVFGWKVPSTATSINDIPEAIRNVGSIDKRKYTDADIQAAATAGGFVVIQLIDGQIESYVPSAKAFRGYKETATSVVENLNADLVKAAQGSADLNALIQSGAVAAFEKPGEVRMVHVSDLGLGRNGVTIEDPWGGQQTQTEGRYGFIVLDQGDKGPQYYMVNAEATGLPASYVPANKESADIL
ncbi:MAG: hypothetical protein V2A70_04085, partial [Candidatus Omnitrophota bacterium]